MEAIQTDSRIAKAVRLLNEDPSRTLADLARGCTLSISRLSHLFRAETGLTLKQFRRNRRFKAAMKMLATTDMPIKQIAYTLGYRHTSSFVRAFEIDAGVSPSDYRRSEVRDHDATASNKSLNSVAHLGLDQVRDAQSHRSVSVSVGSRESQELG
jgi:AraC family transcriptional regulator of arabinose operon